MVLINCPECGREVSSTCEQCIHCGYRITQDDVQKFNDKLYENLVNKYCNSNSVSLRSGGPMRTLATVFSWIGGILSAIIVWVICISIFVSLQLDSLFY